MIPYNRTSSRYFHIMDFFEKKQAEDDALAALAGAEEDLPTPEEAYE